MTFSFRRGWRQEVPNLAFGAFWTAWVTFLSDWDVRGVLVMLAVYSALVVWTHRRFGTDLTPAAIFLRGYTERAIPWSQVRSIQTRRSFVARVVELDVGDRPVRLYAPRHLPFVGADPAFDEKAATIERYWRERVSTSAGSLP